jgi:cystathionine beta-synthase
MDISDQVHLSGICDSVMDAIGWTPAVRLSRLFANDRNVEVVAKLEFMNPGGSIKDRMVKYMLNEAEEKGLLETKRVIESSSGNTAASLAMASAIRKLSCQVAVPDKISEEKRRRIAAYGAEVCVCDSDLPADDAGSYYSRGRELAAQTQAFYLDQYRSEFNRTAHYRSTGPEIWEQMNGHIDYLVCGIGSGGTISGVGRYLKERNPGVRVIGVEPVGSGYRRALGKESAEAGPTVIEGIGKKKPVESFDPSVVDDVIQVTDEQSLAYCRLLAKEEGILAGGSSGTAIAGIAQLIPQIHNARVVTIFPDSGVFYLSKYFDI